MGFGRFPSELDRFRWRIWSHRAQIRHELVLSLGRQPATRHANNIDLAVLARYMQVLSTDFIVHYPQPIINIHHSFLPAFVGGKPHQQVYQRGVKLIGATAHYVTEVLDDGPIIEQDVARVSHRDSLNDLVEKGRDLEKIVLSRAVRWHVENRILLYNNRTIIVE
jgi:formyltetrahydrofolate deformylase